MSFLTMHGVLRHNEEELQLCVLHVHKSFSAGVLPCRHTKGPCQAYTCTAFRTRLLVVGLVLLHCICRQQACGCSWQPLAAAVSCSLPLPIGYAVVPAGLGWVALHLCCTQASSCASERFSVRAQW